MEVRKIENPAGILTKIEFINTGDDNFRASIMTWMQENYPSINHQKFYEQLEEYSHTSCRIRMEE